MHITTSDQERLELGFGNHSCNWGTHIAGLYETEAERDEIIFGYLRRGAERGELQLAVPAERSIREFKASYAELCDDCAAQLEDQELFSISSPRELYYPQGSFHPLDMSDALDEYYRNSQRNGRRHVRAVAEMVWALDQIPGTEHLMAYESRLNYFIPGKPWISICLYNLRKFRGDTIMRVLKTHPYTINKGVITSNPYYIDPDTWLTQNAPQFLPQEELR